MSETTGGPLYYRIENGIFSAKIVLVSPEELDRKVPNTSFYRMKNKKFAFSSKESLLRHYNNRDMDYPTTTFYAFVVEPMKNLAINAATNLKEGIQKIILFTVALILSPFAPFYRIYRLILSKNVSKLLEAENTLAKEAN